MVLNKEREVRSMGPNMRRLRRIGMLIISVPFLMGIVAIPWVNSVDPTVFGLPFLLFWAILTLTATPCAVGLAYVIERRGAAR